jgi:hypothetical protein
MTTNTYRRAWLPPVRQKPGPRYSVTMHRADKPPAYLLEHGTLAEAWLTFVQALHDALGKRWDVLSLAGTSQRAEATLQRGCHAHAELATLLLTPDAVQAKA